MLPSKVTQGLLATDLVILNLIQVAKSTPELAPTLQTSTTCRWDDFEPLQIQCTLTAVQDGPLRTPRLEPMFRQIETF
ncbi:hypothetical protein TNCV_4573351 [Trichonephila clavipes]|nr:hypothetical protein TNCV_4573351 [Trichonephila clavipes]